MTCSLRPITPITEGCYSRVRRSSIDGRRNDGRRRGTGERDTACSPLHTCGAPTNESISKEASSSSLSLSEEHSPPAPLPWRAASLPSPHGTIGAVCPADMGSRCRSLGHALESWQRFSHPAPADGCERHRLFAGVLGRLFAKRRGNVYENTSN
jgi:hypothetical protein